MISRSVVPGLASSGAEPEELGIAGVGENQALLRIEHGQALHHVGQGRVELLVLRLELFLALLEELVLRLESGRELFAFGEIVERVDDAANLSIPIAHGGTGEADVHQRPVLAPAPHVHVA